MNKILLAAFISITIAFVLIFIAFVTWAIFSKANEIELSDKQRYIITVIGILAGACTITFIILMMFNGMLIEWE